MTEARATAETMFDREQGREHEINQALMLEEKRRSEVIKNMERLRALRLSRENEATSN
jgi:hypothetical protein